MFRKHILGVLAGASVMGILALGAAFSTAVGTPAGSVGTAPADCSEAAADRILASLGFEPELPGGPIAGQALCGEFMGPGSQAMVVTLYHGACRPNSGWLVLGLVDGAWKVVFGGDNLFGVLPFTAVGPGFRETLPVFRAGDTDCFPTGGSKGRTWHWNGTKFVHGRFKVLTVGGEFVAPGGRFGCLMGDAPGFQDSAIGGASCYSRTHPHTVTLSLRGRLFVCPKKGQMYCYGSVRKSAPTLSYGKETTLGRFRCVSLRRGVRCTRTGTGKGFLFNDRGVRRVP